MSKISKKIIAVTLSGLSVTSPLIPTMMNSTTAIAATKKKSSPKKKSSSKSSSKKNTKKKSSSKKKTGKKSSTKKKAKNKDYLNVPDSFTGKACAEFEVTFKNNKITYDITDKTGSASTGGTLSPSKKNNGAYNQAVRYINSWYNQANKKANGAASSALKQAKNDPKKKGSLAVRKDKNGIQVDIWWQNDNPQGYHFHVSPDGQHWAVA